MKKILCKVTMASVLMAILLSNTVLAVSPEVLAKLREFPTTKMELKDFSKEVTIYFVGKDGKKKNIGKDFKYGYKALNNRTSVGIRDLSEALGVDIKWDNENRVVILKTEDKELIYPVDKKVMANNGELVELDTSSVIDPSQGRTFAPLRSIAETLGYKVTWDQATFTATLYAPGVEVDKKEEQKPEHESKPISKYSSYIKPVKIKKFISRDTNLIPPVKSDAPYRFGTIKEEGFFGDVLSFKDNNLKIDDVQTLTVEGSKIKNLKIHNLKDGQIDFRIKKINSISYSDKGYEYEVSFDADRVNGYFLSYLILEDNTLVNCSSIEAYVEDYNVNLSNKRVCGVLLESILKTNHIPEGEYLLLNIDSFNMPGKINQDKGKIEINKVL